MELVWFLLIACQMALSTLLGMPHVHYLLIGVTTLNWREKHLLQLFPLIFAWVAYGSHEHYPTHYPTSDQASARWLLLLFAYKYKIAFTNSSSLECWCTHDQKTTLAWRSAGIKDTTRSGAFVGSFERISCHCLTHPSLD